MKILILTRNSLYCFLLFIFLLLLGCEDKLRYADDFEKAKMEMENYRWTEAERLLGRYLKEEEDIDKRWKAWNELIAIINRAGSEPRITLEYLDAMLYEFESNELRYKDILYKIGLINEDLWLFDRAADVWLLYINIDGLSGTEAIDAHRRLAKIYYLTKQFESAEDILNNCLGLDVKPNELTFCMYDLAEVNLVQGRWKKTSDLAAQILDMEVGQEITALTLFLLADSLEQQGKLKESKTAFRQCEDIYPNKAVVAKRIEYLDIKMK